MKNRFYLLIAFFYWSLCLFSCSVKEDAVIKKIQLSDGWKVQSSAKLNTSGKVISSGQVTTDGWYPATVPSTIMGVLTRNGLYSDVLEGTNYKNIDKNLFNCSWWYLKEFKISALPAGKYASLTFDGVSYAANVWLNGELVMSRDSLYGPFRRFTFNVTPYLKETNRLAVEVFRAQPGEPNIGFVDWNPRPADENMGIFREVHLSMTGEVAMTNTAVHSKVNTKTLNEAWLTVETQLKNLSDRQINGTLEGIIEDQEFSMPVSINPGEKKVVKITSEQAKNLHLRNPRLWWCNNMGKPDMYKLNLKFKVDNKITDTDTVSFGVREIRNYFTDRGDRGFLLNGKPVLIKSAGWTDDIFLRDTPETNEIQTSYVKDMNLNSIRFENIWGTSQNIYDLCDRNGLLALVGWSCHWEWEQYLGTPNDDFGGIKSEKDMDLIAKSFKDQVIWLRNHPSIIAWYVGSDMIPRPELEKKYLAILSEIDDRSYVASAKGNISEISGPTGMKMNGPYEYVGPNYWYIDSLNGGAFGFNTETGIGAQLPVIESIKKMIPANKLWPVNETWNYHCTVSTSGMNSLDVLTETINQKYGKAKNLEDYLKKADLLNYEGTKAMFEAFRINIPKTTGIVQWMLNSAWPSLYWQLYDYYLIPTAAYYSVKKSNLPQQLIYNYKDNAVYVVNEGREATTLTGKVLLYGLDSKLIQEKKLEVKAEPYSSKKVIDLGNITDNAFLLLQLFDAKGTFSTDNFYCLSSNKDEYDWKKTDWIRTPLKSVSNFKKLSDLPQAEYSINTSIKKGNKDNTLEVTIENKTPYLGFFIRFALKDEKGKLLRPVFWEDNYVTLQPLEKRTFKCLLPQTFLAEKNIYLYVSGWNSEEKKINISNQ